MSTASIVSGTFGMNGVDEIATAAATAKAAVTTAAASAHNSRNMSVGVKTYQNRKHPPTHKDTSDTIESSTSSSTDSSEDNNTTEMDPQAILAEAERLVVEEEQLFVAARMIIKIRDTVENGPNLLTPKHFKILQMANDCEITIADLLGDPRDDSSWIRQGAEAHGDFDSYDIYYKVDPQNSAKLTCRIDSPIDQSLLVPLMAVFNEIDLYPEWIPEWKRPIHVGVKDAHTIKKLGRVAQLLRILGIVPWPFSPREVIMQVQAIDEIDSSTSSSTTSSTLSSSSDQQPKNTNIAKTNESNDRNNTKNDSNGGGGYVGIRMFTPPIGSDPDIPPLDPRLTRVDFEGAILFRACPTTTDHAASASGTGIHGKGRSSSKTESRSTASDSTNTKSNNKPKILTTFKMIVDPHMSAVPMSVINFVTRTVIGRIWYMLLQVAEGIRDGTRFPKHLQRIREQKEFYDWVEARVQILLDKLEQEREEQRFVASLQT